MQRFWERFRNSIRDIFKNVSTTFKTAEDVDHVGASFMKIRDFFVYFLFMCVLFTLTLGVYDWNAYHLTNAVRRCFIERMYYCDDERTNIHNVTAPEDFHCYMDKGFMEMLEKRPFWGARGTENETLLLTKPRMRQVRVQVEPCSILMTGQSCTSEFREDNEDKTFYHLANDTAWIYNPPEVMGHYWFKGHVSWYNSAGYYFTIKSREQYNYYMDNKWTDERTRAVFLDFTFYNININIFCVCQIIFEWPATGGVLPSYKFNAVKLIRYNDAFDYRVLACEIVLAVFSIYYTMELIFEIIYFKKRFLQMWDNWVDLFIVILCWSSILALIQRLVAANDFIVNHLDKDKDKDFVDYIPITQVQLNCDRITALALFCGFLRFYRYLHFDTIDLLFVTLKVCFKDMASFCFLFSIILFAYSQLGSLLFQNYLQQYMTIQEASSTLLQVMMGEFNYTNVTNVASILGPLFVVSFVIFVVFLLLNMFFAIINATFTVVSSNTQISRKAEYLPYLTHCFKMILNKIDVELPRKKKVYTNEERFREMLIDSGYTDREIGMFFSRYTINNDRKLAEEIFKTIVQNKKVPEEYMEQLQSRMTVIKALADTAQSKANYFMERINQMHSGGLTH